MNPPAPRFLVLRGGAIGDFVLTLPALQALRERWPDAHIELVGYPHIANLALAAGLVDHVESLDRAEMARYFSARPSLDERQMEYVQSFSLILSYLHDPGGIVRENLMAAGARQVIYGSPIVTEGHAIDHLVKPLETLAIYASGAVPRLTLRDDLLRRGRAWLSEHGLGGDAIAIHPGSGSPAKCWPAERFVALARIAAERGLGRPFFILGEADDAAARTVSRDAPAVPVLKGVTLVELAAVVAPCKAYVGNDSGVTHVAAATGVPVVALFGPSDPDRWGPRGPNVRIVRAPRGELGALGVDDVAAAL